MTKQQPRAAQIALFMATQVDDETLDAIQEHLVLDGFSVRNLNVE